MPAAVSVVQFPAIKRVVDTMTIMVKKMDIVPLVAGDVPLSDVPLFDNLPPEDFHLHL